MRMNAWDEKYMNYAVPLIFFRRERKKISFFLCLSLRIVFSFGFSVSMPTELRFLVVRIAHQWIHCISWFAWKMNAKASYRAKIFRARAWKIYRIDTYEVEQFPMHREMISRHTQKKVRHIHKFVYIRKHTSMFSIIWAHDEDNKYKNRMSKNKSAHTHTHGHRHIHTKSIVPRNFLLCVILNELWTWI